MISIPWVTGMTPLHFPLELGTCRDVTTTTDRVSPEWAMETWVTKTWIPTNGGGDHQDGECMVTNGHPSTAHGGSAGTVNDFPGTPN